MPDNKIYIFAGGRKVAEGCSKALAADSAMGDALDALKVAADGAAHSVQELQATIDEIKLREKMAIHEIPFLKELPELSFRVKISRRRMRRWRLQLMGSKPRLPRKLKKAAKHADHADYPRTKWVRRLTNIVHHIMLCQYRRFMYHQQKQQCLENLLNLNEK